MISVLAFSAGLPQCLPLLPLERDIILATLAFGLDMAGSTCHSREVPLAVLDAIKLFKVFD